MRADIRFDGPRDLAGFVRPAQAEGPDVLVRPGPCICAERDNGQPARLADRDPRDAAEHLHGPFSEAVDRWFDVLINFGLWARLTALAPPGPVGHPTDRPAGRVARGGGIGGGFT